MTIMGIYTAKIVLPRGFFQQCCSGTSRMLQSAPQYLKHGKTRTLYQGETRRRKQARQEGFPSLSRVCLSVLCQVSAPTFSSTCVQAIGFPSFSCQGRSNFPSPRETKTEHVGILVYPGWSHIRRNRRSEKIDLEVEMQGGMKFESHTISWFKMIQLSH